MKRRKFLEVSSMGAIAMGISPDISTGSRNVKSGHNNFESGKRSPMNEFKNVTLAVPRLFDSQLSRRLDLARKRTTQYPLDSMDFILMDLERPLTSRRFADFCTGDLTGRLLWFLSSTDGIDEHSDPRLEELFERILKQKQPNGLFEEWRLT